MITKSIPSMFTVGNLFLGVMAIILGVQGIVEGESRYLDYASILVIIGMLLDGLDGHMARMLNATSEFGKELDSLSDVVTFGVAPAIIMNLVFLNGYGAWGIVVTAMFPICGALRLARFNVKPGEPGFFTGLPITAAGGILATLALYHEVFHPLILIMGVVLLSLLMVSNFKYPKPKKVGIPRTAFWITPLIIGLFAVLAYQFPSGFPKIAFIPLVLYALYGIKKSMDGALRRRRRRKKRNFGKKT
ncbi:CDP-diacylglycerol--serine O-phosphatidyltransferase [Bacillus horti]|uniref:CDP-diacylglycerol--serine O-phosphatidyltransferase n=1 Tax=Caldalkalibacillus horti TaxID=77523 RepID=A0ABT9VYH9_9BACI|nr:CDP-diacylglycerol--serine O-phosphatidyltransferase [Bacillus horti]MDQ0166036.1 CDP-diacylglycerol--serine O-phosphatidyltransferase [Bacillus horti]